MAATLSQYLREFLEHLEIEKNRSPKTIQNYEFYLGRFLEWLGENKKPSDITADGVRQYRLWLNRLVDVHNEPLKKNTQNYHLIALRSWLKYLSKRDVETVAAEKIELMRMPDREVSFLDGNDVSRLLEAPIQYHKNTKTQKHKNTPRLGKEGPSSAQADGLEWLIKYRDKAILELLFSTGLRVSELAGLKRDNVNLKREEFTVMGKGLKTRVVFLSEQAKYWVKKYLDTRMDPNPYLFVSHDKIHSKTKTLKHKNTPASQSVARPPLDSGSGAPISSAGKENKKTQKTLDVVEQPLTQRSIQRLVQKYARAAGITKPVTPHTLRHSFATDLLQNGADIRSVQTMLGHSSITTTQIYTHITDKELRNIHKKFHGRGRGG